jgi:hypothetical protein
VAVDTTGLESQLADLQKKHEALQQWSKNLREQKDIRIAELEKELAGLKAQPAANEVSTAPVCDGKGLPLVVCRMRRMGKVEK